MLLCAEFSVALFLVVCLPEDVKLFVCEVRFRFSSIMARQRSDDVCHNTVDPGSIESFFEYDQDVK